MNKVTMRLLMVENRHSGVAAQLQVTNAITQIRYAPPPGYDLDLEVFPVSALRQRVGAKRLQDTERIEFYMLIYVTEGRCKHMVDFELLDCGPGTLLVFQPGQVHRFDMMADWEGWVLLYRPEFRRPMKNPMSASELEVFQYLEDLPVLLALSDNEQQLVMSSIATMFEDAKSQSDRVVLHALLRSQLYALLIRLYLIQSCRRQPERASPLAVQRFKRYRSAVEQEFHRWHRVSDYAKFLGCSEKTLGRTTLDVVGMNAKTYLTQRIVLEAKRLLTHTNLSISLIADTLGFDEATNFIKFFCRETGCSPGAFRKQNVGY
jgi:AraC-like DNA-binding protein